VPSLGSLSYRQILIYGRYILRVHVHNQNVNFPNRLAASKLMRGFFLKLF